MGPHIFPQETSLLMLSLWKKILSSSHTMSIIDGKFVFILCVEWQLFRYFGWDSSFSASKLEAES